MSDSEHAAASEGERQQAPPFEADSSRGQVLDDARFRGKVPFVLVFMLLLGGFGHLFGPVVGAFVFIFLQDQVMSVTEYWRFVFGAVLAAVVIFLPHGLMGLVARRVEG